MKLNIVKQNTTAEELIDDLKRFFCSSEYCEYRIELEDVVGGAIYVVEVVGMLKPEDVLIRPTDDLRSVVSLENLRELASYLFIHEWDLRIY